MKRANISKLKNSLSRYLHFVREGETILITDRDTPFAEITPIQKRSENDANWEDAILADMVRRGVVRPPKISEPLNIKVKIGKPSGVLKALLEEREKGR